MDDQQIQEKGREILQILITEHSNLQAARSATIFEANTGTEDMIAARGINRIRHYYTEIGKRVKVFHYVHS